MKRIMSALILPVLLIGSTACGFLQKDLPEVKDISGKSTINSIPLDQTDEDHVKSIIESRAKEVLSSLKDKDMEKLSQVIHPEKGVRFSPYTHVDINNDLVSTTDQVKNIISNQEKYKWGSYDGSGEPIELTFEDYYKKFIYDEDFIKAPEVGYNKILGKGNTINNSFEAYPKSIIVEYHFPGFDPQYEGMDWRSLKLVFEKKDDTWYIVGIIHDQWTI